MEAGKESNKGINHPSASLGVDYHLRWVLKIHFFAFDLKKPHNPIANFPDLPQYYNIFLNHHI